MRDRIEKGGANYFRFATLGMFDYSRIIRSSDSAGGVYATVPSPIAPQRRARWCRRARHGAHRRRWSSVATAAPARAATRSDVLQAAAAYARQQGYHVGIAVLDTQARAVLRAPATATGIFASESLIKVFIATRLLHPATACTAAPPRAPAR